MRFEYKKKCVIIESRILFFLHFYLFNLSEKMLPELQAMWKHPFLSHKVMTFMNRFSLERFIVEIKSKNRIMNLFLLEGLAI